MIAPHWSEWLGDTLLATSVMMALVLLIGRPVARAFGAQIAYLLWLIPAARFVMPTLTSPAQEGMASDIPSVTASLDGIAAVPSASVAWVEPSYFDTLAATLPIVWLGGAALCLAVIGISHLVFLRRLISQAIAAPEYSGFRVIRSPAISLPLAIGIVRPLIVVPADFEMHFGATERAHILKHEAEHHRHGDLWANLAAALVLSAHWFNPVAWYSWKAFRLDQEKCCDARVIARANGQERAVYAATLAKAVIRPRPPTLRLVAPMIVQKDLKERLKMLKDTRAFSRPRTAAGLAGVGLLLATGLMVTATVVPATAAPNAAASDAVPMPRHLHCPRRLPARLLPRKRPMHRCRPQRCSLLLPHRLCKTANEAKGR